MAPIAPNIHHNMSQNGIGLIGAIAFYNYKQIITNVSYFFQHQQHLAQEWDTELTRTVQFPRRPQGMEVLPRRYPRSTEMANQVRSRWPVSYSTCQTTVVAPALTNQTLPNRTLPNYTVCPSWWQGSSEEANRCHVCYRHRKSTLVALPIRLCTIGLCPIIKLGPTPSNNVHCHLDCVCKQTATHFLYIFFIRN